MSLLDTLGGSTSGLGGVGGQMPSNQSAAQSAASATVSPTVTLGGNIGGGITDIGPYSVTFPGMPQLNPGSGVTGTDSINAPFGRIGVLLQNPIMLVLVIGVLFLFLFMFRR